jgi:hypothetical protein
VARKISGDSKLYPKLQRNSIPLKKLNHGTRPFKVLTIDFIHMPQRIKEKKYCVTIMDNFSRFLYIHPTVRDRAVDAVSPLENFILEHGLNVMGCQK